MVIGTGEWLLIGIILVLVFSASRMGQLGNALGSFVHQFRKASRGEQYVDVTGRRLDHGPQPPDVQGQLPEHRDS